jgi:hypothetical protein
MYGALMIHESGCQYVIFHRIIGDMFVVDSEGIVRLVGPDHCIKVDDYLTTRKCLFDWKLSKFEMDSEDLLWFRYSHQDMYDTLIKKTVESNSGPIEVVYAVYKRAAEGVLSVTLKDWEREGENAGIAVQEGVFAKNKDLKTN